MKRRSNVWNNGVFIMTGDRSTISAKKYLCTIVRLAVIPLLSIPILLLIPSEYETIRITVLLAAAAPVGFNVAIFAQLCKKGYTDAVKDECLSTVFSILSVPSIMAVANLAF